MTYGYSQYTIAANKSADRRSLGVVLGKTCIARGISVYSVAEVFNVSRQTVYNWFEGKHDPSPELTEAIKAFLASLDK